MPRDGRGFFCCKILILYLAEQSIAIVVSQQSSETTLTLHSKVLKREIIVN